MLPGSSPSPVAEKEEPCLLLVALPSELVELILLLLTAKELSLLGGTCRELRLKCAQQLAWRNLYAVDFRHNPPFSLSLAGTLESAKLAYLSSRLAFQQRQGVRLAVERNRKRNLKLQARRRRVHQVFELFSARYFMPVFGVCMLALLAMLCDGSSPIWQVFVPIWVVLAYLLLGFAVSALLYTKRLTRTSALLLEEAGPTHRLAATLFVLGEFALITLFCALLLVRLSTGQSSWWEVFSPLWVAIAGGMGLLLPLAVRADSLFRKEAAVLAGLVLAPWLVFAVLLAWWLSQSNSNNRVPLYLVFVPLYAQSVGYFVWAAAVGREWTETGTHVWYWTLICLLGLPWLAFEILIVLWADGFAPELTVAQALAPLLVWFSVVTLEGLAECGFAKDTYRENDLLEDQRMAAHMAARMGVRRLPRPHQPDYLPQDGYFWDVWNGQQQQPPQQLQAGFRRIDSNEFGLPPPLPHTIIELI
ncbi:hypothetical protein BASA81_003596 [Batrachochytrium salamandrivorans]|nr:hypothetical protein BASA81_003596 [Batrachochytrium salamandrivorans]